MAASFRLPPAAAAPLGEHGYPLSRSSASFHLRSAAPGASQSSLPCTLSAFPGAQASMQPHASCRLCLPAAVPAPRISAASAPGAPSATLRGGDCTPASAHARSAHQPGHWALLPPAWAGPSSSDVHNPPVAPGTGAWEGQQGPLIVLPGGGMFFYWQLGALDALSQHMDLSRVRFHGASAGALAGTLAACGVGPRYAAEAALAISRENNLWENPTGLAGVWGPLVREWLHRLLPLDAADVCSGRLCLQVLELPSISRRTSSFRHAGVSSFQGRDDLIDCCMASVHIPFFMDRRPWARFRGRRCIDGSILAPPYSEDRGGQCLVLNHTYDEVMRQRRWDFLSLGAEDGGYVATWDWIQSMMCRGKLYVDELSAKGELSCLSFKGDPLC